MKTLIAFIWFLLWILLVNIAEGAIFGVSPKLFSKSMTEIQSELGVIKNNQVSLNASVSALNGNVLALNAKIAAIASAQVGLNNSLTQARDITTVNDSKLMDHIFKGLFALMTSICFGLMAIIRGKNKWIANLVKSNSSKDERADIWMRKYIGTLTRMTVGNVEMDKILDESKEEVEQ